MEQTLLAVPVPGRLLTTLSILVVTLQRLTGHGLEKVMLSGLASLCLLVAASLLLFTKGAG